MILIILCPHINSQMLMILTNLHLRINNPLFIYKIIRTITVYMKRITLFRNFIIHKYYLFIFIYF